MPSIDDLKGTADQGFPTLTQGESIQGDPSALTKATRAVDRPISPGVTQGPSTNRIVPPGGAKGMIIQKGTGAATDERVAADFSSIPKRDEKAESVGIEKRESITKDVFGAGGPFDQYIKEKMADYQKDMDKFDADKESAEFEKAEESTGEVKDIVVDEDTTINQATAYRSVDIMKPKEKTMEDKNYDLLNELEDDGEVLGVEGEEQTTPVIEEPSDIIPPVEEPDPYATAEDTVVHEDAPVENVPLEYAKPEVPVDSYSDAIEVESVKEETVPIQPKEEPAPKIAPKASIDKRLNKITRSFMSLPVEDEEDDTPSAATVDDDEDYNILKNLVKQKIAPISEKLDLKSFTIVKKGTTSNNILAGEAAIAKWVLPNTGVTIQMREISGSNLENMRSLLDRTPADNRGALKIIYDHIVSPKPQNFEKWLKSISFNDLNHLFMAVYIASFADSNYIPKDCTNPSCAKPFLTDNIAIMDMVKFENAETEKKFWALYNSDVIESKGLYVTEVTPISKAFAIAFKEPSLYDVMIESTYYNDQFVDRYGQIVQYVPFIDTVYHIDYNTHSLVPVEYEMYDNNIGRTSRSKVQRYDKVINTLNADENAILAAYIRKINEKTEWFTYQIPETTCPHCGATVPAVGDQQASGLVFLRNRLALLATT